MRRKKERVYIYLIFIKMINDDFHNTMCPIKKTQTLNSHTPCLECIKNIQRTIPLRLIGFEKNAKEIYDVISGVRRKNFVGNMNIGIGS